MSYEIVNDSGEVVNSFEDKEMAKEFVDESDEEDLAVIDTIDEELIYP